MIFFPIFIGFFVGDRPTNRNKMIMKWLGWSPTPTPTVLGVYEKKNVAMVGVGVGVGVGIGIR